MQSRHERHILGHAVHEHRSIVNPVELVRDAAVDRDLYGSRRQFWHRHPHGWWRDVVSVVLLCIKRAASVIVGDVSSLDGNRAIRQFRDIRADWRVDFLIAISRLLVVEGIVVVVGRTTHHDRDIAHGQDVEARAVPKTVPESVVAEVHIDIVMNVDVAVQVEIMRPFAGSLDRTGRGMCIHVADASMIGTVNDRGLAALHGCACGFRTGRWFAALRWLRTTALLLTLLGVQEWYRNQKRGEADADFPARNRIGKFHGYLPSFLCVWFSALISFTSIFDAPAGGSKVKRKSGSFVWKSQLEKIAVYSGVPSSSL